MVAVAESRHGVKVISDTQSQVVSFAIVPIGSNRWIEVDFGDRPFGYPSAILLKWHDDEGCLRDLRAMLSDGRMIVAHGFDLYRLHVCGLGFRFYEGHQGGTRLP
jgi:hypothetical protein